MQFHKGFTNMKIVADREGLVIADVCVASDSIYSIADRLEHDYQCLCARHDEHDRMFFAAFSAGSDEAGWNAWYEDEIGGVLDE